MRPQSTRTIYAGLALAALLGSGLAQAASSPFQLTGSTDSGPLAGTVFSGSFAYDASPVVGDFSGSVALQAFQLQFAGQTYDLASADAPATAMFEAGQFIGLDYTDADSADAGLRPWLSLVPSLTGQFADAYLAYQGADGLGGFGSYSISAVPEPGQWALLLGGLALVGVAGRRSR
ncbi:PEP-CTERM sorting domain-containing protein [Pseudaquabacterium pictum]|uniref:Ice-binding protein C-terminal domain-containing protein n=1 Tax=Pseudaquabacterium pictum TaxID=2315236 RepID=A0A480B3S7_9BURK|nr:PEP-CTERM sorting domain-containing protein [Rubrivivax pictus]GCL65728.1 hypothetical protein AQPW35_48090 [Rubrivivax pictus]